MSAKKWNFYYDKNQNPFAISHVVDAVSLWIAIGLLWSSFILIIKEHFPNFVSCVTYVYDLDNYVSPSTVAKTIGLSWIVIIIFIIVLWLPSSGFISKTEKRLTWIIRVAAIAIPILYICLNMEKMPKGALTIANQYMKLFNPYQGTNHSFPDGTLEYGPVVFSAGLMLLWLFVWGASKLLKQRVALVLFPLIALLMEFMVGLSPSGSGMALLFVAAFLLMIPNGTKAWKHGVVLLAAVLSVFLSSTVFAEKIEQLSSNRRLVDDWEQNLDFSKLFAIDFEKLFELSFQLDNEILDNHQPSYSGDIVLEIQSTYMPNSKLYLRGYCGTVYKNGNWRWDTSAFDDACKAAEYSKKEVAQIVSYTPYAVMVSGANLAIPRMEYHISYVGTTGNIAYVPYFFDYNALDEEYEFTGDFLLKKSVGDKNISFIGGQYGDLLEVGSLAYWTKYAEGYETMLWYNSVVTAYGESTTDLECIKAAAEYIKSQVTYPSEYSILQESYLPYDEAGLSAVLNNIYRIKLAEKVRIYLAEQMSYSVMLDDLPIDVDPVEYALTVGHEGYCMHYASAAALILKEMGVPTRYVSGYVVRPSDFTYESDNYNYCAQVPDYNAHAWVEIYMENVGWIPMEMTEGYTSDSEEIPTRVNPNRWEQISEKLRDQLENGENPTEVEPTETQDSSESEIESTGSEISTESEGTTESEGFRPPNGDRESENDSSSENSESEATETEDNEEGGDGKGGNDGNVFPTKWKIILCAVIGYLICIGVIYGLRFRDALFERNLKRIMEKEQTRRAVRIMNRQVYRRLHWKNPRYMSDKAYLENLIETVKTVEPEDWERYMEIVKRAHYSREDISVEEMNHCYWCYKAI